MMRSGDFDADLDHCRMNAFDAPGNELEVGGTVSVRIPVQSGNSRARLTSWALLVICLAPSSNVFRVLVRKCAAFSNTYKSMMCSCKIDEHELDVLHCPSLLFSWCPQ